MVTKDGPKTYEELVGRVNVKVKEAVMKEPNSGQSPIFAEMECVARLIDENHSLSWEIEKRLQPILEVEDDDSIDPDFLFDDTSDDNGMLLIDLRRHSLGLRKLLARQQAVYNRLQL